MTAIPVAALREHLDLLSVVARHPVPEPMEKLGFTHGLVHYRHHVAGPAGPATLHVEGVRDLAQIFADGKLAGTLERDSPIRSVDLQIPEGGLDLEILVEPYGRVNYGPHLVDRKGLIGPVRLDYQNLSGWDIRVLTLEDLSGLPAPAQTPRGQDGAAADAGSVEGPIFHHAAVALPQGADAFVAVPGSARCLVWVNGFLLGRLWDRGPQVTLYAPGPLWRMGTNDVVVLALDGPSRTSDSLVVEIRDLPDLGPEAPPPVF